MTLWEFLVLMKKNVVLIVVVTLVCTAAGAAWAVTRADEYTATTSLYAVTQTADDSDSLGAYGDLYSGQEIANDIEALAELSSTRTAVAESLGVESIAGYAVAVDADTNSRVVTLSVTGGEAQMAADVANAYAEYCIGFAADELGVDSATQIAEAGVPESASGPNRVLYVALGFCLGLFLAVCWVVLVDTLRAQRRRGEAD